MTSVGVTPVEFVASDVSRLESQQIATRGTITTSVRVVTGATRECDGVTQDQFVA